MLRSISLGETESSNLPVCSGASEELGEGVNFSIFVGFAQAEDGEP